MSIPFVSFRPDSRFRKALPSQFWLLDHPREENSLHHRGMASSTRRNTSCEPYEGLGIAVPDASRKAFQLGCATTLGHCLFHEPFEKMDVCGCQKKISGRKLVAVGVSTVCFVAIVGLDEDLKIFQFGFDLSDYKDILLFDPLSVCKFIELDVAFGPTRQECCDNLAALIDEKHLDHHLVADLHTLEFKKPIAEKLEGFAQVVSRIRASMTSATSTTSALSHSTIANVPTTRQKRARAEASSAEELSDDDPPGTPSGGMDTAASASPSAASSSAEAGDEEPLPAGWYFTIDLTTGRPYFHSIYNQTTWVRPRSPAKPLKLCLRNPGGEAASYPFPASSASSSSSVAKPAASRSRRRC